MATKYVDITSTTWAAQTPKQLTASITGISKANGAVVTAANDFSNGDIVRITGAGGMTEINGLSGTVASASATQFTITEINSTAYTTYTSGGTATKQMALTNSVRVLYDDTLKGVQVANALQRAKEVVIEIY